jgi:predicted esterase
MKRRLPTRAPRLEFPCPPTSKITDVRNKVANARAASFPFRAILWLGVRDLASAILHLQPGVRDLASATLRPKPRRPLVNLFPRRNNLLGLNLPDSDWLVRAARRFTMVARIAAIFAAPILLSVLLSSPAPAATPSATTGLSGSAARMQTLDKNDPAFFKKMYTDKKGYKMPYRVYVPANYDANKKYPLILFFHSGSGRGFNNEQQIMHENAAGTHVWTLPANQEQFPAFVLAPQCSIDDNWGDPDLNEINPKMQMALEVLAEVQKDYSIDADRIVLVGQSMGGLGVWALLQTFPEKWAAAVVVSSFDNFTNEKAITRVPLWLFQGDADLTVPVILVRGMVKELRKGNAQLRYTEYHNMDHNIWEKAFAEPELAPWLAVQRRGHPAVKTAN